MPRRVRKPGVTDVPSQLTASAAEFLSAPNERRIRAILSERWVHYPRAGQAIQVLSRLLDHPRTTRMPSIAVYGDSGMGKTMIMEKFRRDHPPHFDHGSGVEKTPVLALQMAGRPAERRLYAQILAALGAPHSPRSTVVDLEQVTLRLMRAVEVKVLLFDEVHNILAGTFREQRVALNTLRYLTDIFDKAFFAGPWYFYLARANRVAKSGYWDVSLPRAYDERVPFAAPVRLGGVVCQLATKRV